MANICMLLNNFEPPYGGPERQVMQLVSRLKTMGHNVIIVARGSGNAPAYEKTAHFELYRIKHRGLGTMCAARRLYKLRNDIDVLHVHGVGRMASVAVWFARHFNKRVFIKVTTAGHIYKGLLPGFKGLLRRISPFARAKVARLKQADGMIAISQEILDEFTTLGFATDKIHFIPNGVDTTKFYPTDATEKVQLRQGLNLSLDKKIVVFTGKISRRKGIDVLLQAWSKSQTARNRAVLVLVGSGDGQQDSLEDWVSAYVQEQNLGASVRRIGAVTNVAQYLGAADIFAFPSRREGLPNSLLEAMAMGLVCIVSAIGGNTDLVFPSKTGMLVPVDDVGALTSALDEAIEHFNITLGNNAARFVQDKYSIDTTVKALDKVFSGS